jgi:WD40 repeat protein
MSDALQRLPSLTERARSVSAGAPVVGAAFIEDVAAFALGEETLLLVSAGEERRLGVHQGAILAVAGDGRRVLTGGDDGHVVLTDREGSSVVATDPRRRWIDAVAIGPSGAVAWSAGKTAFVATGKGEPRTLDRPSSIGGLAFAPKGFRLAIAHYGGASLWFPNAESAPETLEWKGSHLGVSFSPDGKFLITSMQEAMLHGWRLVDRKNMRMSGYKAKVRSLDWSADGNWLATGGSGELILWPFRGKDGPMGKAPEMLAPTSEPVVRVACHPKEGVVAVGYQHGLVLLVQIEGGGETLVKRPGASPVSALAWNSKGTLLAYGTEDGEAGLVDVG